jgi:O-antigen ligase
MVIAPFSFHLQIFFISFSAFGLLAIWALPETIAFRHVFIGLGFIASLFYLKPRLNLLKSIGAWPLWILLSLFVWLLVHLWFFSMQPSLQFGELRSTWARSLGVLPLGLALGLYLSSFSSQTTLDINGAPGKISLLLFVGLCATPLIFMSGYLEQSFEAKQWLSVHAKPWYDFPYLQKPPFVVATALLLPMCCILLQHVIKNQANWWWGILAIIAIILCVSSNYLSNTKNGMAMVAFIMGGFGLYAMWDAIFGWAKSSFAKRIFSILVVVCILGGVGWGVKSHLQQNPAWAHIIANAKVGMDIDRQNFWKNRYIYSAVPLNEYQVPVDGSTYERTAWFTAGVRLLQERPQGYGLTQQSFGWMAGERWPDFYPPIGSLRGMTHSGWLDLALGIGIPGVLLILIPLGVAWYRSLKMNTLWGSYVSWTVPAFTLTWLITEVIGARHFIELMVFITAFFIGITLPNKESSNQKQSPSLKATQ